MDLSEIIDINLVEAYQSFLPGLVAGLVFRLSKEEASQKIKFGTAIGVNIVIDAVSTFPYSPLNHDLAYNVLNDFGGVLGFFCGIKAIDLVYDGIVLLKNYYNIKQ